MASCRECEKWIPRENPSLFSVSDSGQKQATSNWILQKFFNFLISANLNIELTLTGRIGLSDMIARNQGT
jgi:hypothetical protein